MAQELFWKNKDGLTLRALQWHVPFPKAIIAMVHGQGEHIGRYDHVAQWFNAREIGFMGYDHQGFGKSEGKRGHVNSVEDYLDDISILLSEVRQRYPDAPIFLYGHAMGGNLALNFLLKRLPEINGAIVSAPWIRLAFEAPKAKVILGKLLRKVLPDLRLPTGIAAKFISHDAAVVDAYLKDPLVHDKVSASAGISMMEAANWLNQYQGAVPAPLLLMHGSGDKLTSFAASREFCQRVKGDVTFKEWPGFYHEIHNEPEQLEVFQTTYDWLLKHL